MICRIPDATVRVATMERNSIVTVQSEESFFPCQWESDEQFPHLLQVR